MTPQTCLRVFCLACLLGAAPFSTADANQSDQPEIVAQLRQGVPSHVVFEDLPATVADSVREVRLFLLTFADSATADSVYDILLQDDDVESVEPNHHMHLLETHQMSISFPDEDVPVLLTGTEPNAYYQQPAVYSIGLDSAHLISTGSGIRVAVIDNGADLQHPLFSGFLDPDRYDYVDHDQDPSEEPGSLFGHGTFVTGLVRLAAPDAHLVIIRAFDGDGVGDAFTTAKSIQKAVQYGVDIINMSFGTVINSTTLASACQNAIDDGVVLVASVGNSGISDPVYPAAYPDVIAVSAVDTLELITPFSNSGDYVDVCAPGVNLYSALPSDLLWGVWSGTSFAAPLVAAVCGLVAANDTLTPAEMETHIRLSARTELTWGTLVVPDPYYGYGFIDAYNAVLSTNLGDMNNSGTLEVGDLGTVQEIADSNLVPADAIRLQADINCDGKVDGKDVQALAQILFEGGPLPEPCY